MTAVVVAMLGIVVTATVVLAAVGIFHHLAHSPRTKRRFRRWRFLMRSRVRGGQQRLVHAMWAARRTVAGRMGRPRAVVTAVRRALPH